MPLGTAHIPAKEDNVSRLYASIDSDSRKTQATSRGHKHIDTHIRGWSVGVQVEAYADENGDDVFTVYATRGSTGGTLSAQVIGTVRLIDGEPTFTLD